MANKSLFSTILGKLIPRADARNSEGSKAYAFGPEHALAQLAATGCLNRTFYASAEDQLAKVLELAAKVSPRFVAQTALYARERGSMKDMPAVLCAVLASTDGDLLEAIFDRVIDSPKMLRNFVQVVRSGQTGRKSLGSKPKRLVRRWLDARTDEQIFFASIGNDPSLGDVIKMVHPKPRTEARRALYAYLIGKPCEADHLPDMVRQYEAFKTSLGAA